MGWEGHKKDKKDMGYECGGVRQGRCLLFIGEEHARG